MATLDHATSETSTPRDDAAVVSREGVHRLQGEASAGRERGASEEEGDGAPRKQKDSAIYHPTTRMVSPLLPQQGSVSHANNRVGVELTPDRSAGPPPAESGAEGVSPRTHSTPPPTRNCSAGSTAGSTPGARGRGAYPASSARKSDVGGDGGGCAHSVTGSAQLSPPSTTLPKVPTTNSCATQRRMELGSGGGSGGGDGGKAAQAGSLTNATPIIHASHCGQMLGLVSISSPPPAADHSSGHIAFPTQSTVPSSRTYPGSLPSKVEPTPPHTPSIPH